MKRSTSDKMCPRLEPAGSEERRPARSSPPRAAKGTGPQSNPAPPTLTYVASIAYGSDQASGSSAS